MSLSLRTLAHLAPLPLPSMPHAAPEAGRALTALLKKVPNVKHPIAQVGPGLGCLAWVAWLGLIMGFGGVMRL